jgi:hypothetical protein
MATNSGYSYSSHKKWLKRFFVIFLLLLLLTAVFNFQVDSAGVFRPNKGLKYTAVNLLKGNMVVGYPGRNDERELQRLIVENYPGRRDIVAIGSSRTMVLRKRFIGRDIDFFNHSVAGAVIEDYVAIIGLYKRKGVLPKTVIIGLDPWMFNKNNKMGGDFWRVLESYYNEMAAQFPKSSRGTRVVGNAADEKAGVTSTYKQLINLEYTLQNWQYLQKGKKAYVTDTIDVDDYVREPDGSLHFPYSTRFAKMPAGVALDLPEIIYSNFDAISGTELFENLLHYLMAHGVRVVLLLPPLHPDVYRFWQQNPKYAITLKVETYLRELARANNITVIGSFDPGRYGFRADDFADAIHGHETVMERLFEGFR